MKYSKLSRDELNKIAHNHNIFKPETLSFKKLMILINLRDYVDLSLCTSSFNLNQQLLSLAQIFALSYPLNHKMIYETPFNPNYPPKAIAIKKIKLMCRRDELPIHVSTYGDEPHFSLQINDIPGNFHLYLDGRLTQGFGLMYSLPDY